MKIDILTLFPGVALGPLGESIVGRAQAAGLVEIRGHQLRDWSMEKNGRVDGRPCGGGPGMVIEPGPVFAAVRELRTDKTHVILMTPQGIPLKQEKARSLTAREHLLIICGHYEGIDERVMSLVDETISIGDYILTNGALAAAVLCDAVVRLLPGALGDERSAIEESFREAGMLEGPCFTRPVDFEGMQVPEVLLSGDHQKIAIWRREMAVERTRRLRDSR